MKKKNEILLILFFFLGLCILIYPKISNYIATNNAVQAVSTYKKHILNLSKEEIAKEKQKAIEYNENLRGELVIDPFNEKGEIEYPDNYKEVLNIDGIMGYIEIPKINVDLPIKHGTSDAVLRSCVGHMEQTPLPVGGVGINPVLTSHTGLPEAKLFSDLTSLVEGDVFYLYILDEKLTYKVDKISVIKPEELNALVAIAGEDHVTLMTCTPYGINSHRLLVRGIRVENEEEIEFNAIIKNIDISLWIAMGIIIITIIILIFKIILDKIKKNNNDE